MDHTEKKNLLIELCTKMIDCPECPWKHIKTQTVLPNGPANAEVAIIGRSPGVDEDREGYPFVGRGGAGLNRFLTAVGLDRSLCWISNSAKCYGGPGDPKPTPEVYKACVPWVKEEIRIIQPKLLITLGNDAMNEVLGYTGSCTSYQGNLVPIRNSEIQACPLSHPGYWIRNPSYFEEEILGKVVPKIKTILDKLGISHA